MSTSKIVVNAEFDLPEGAYFSVIVEKIKEFDSNILNRIESSINLDINNAWDIIQPIDTGVKGHGYYIMVNFKKSSTGMPFLLYNLFDHNRKSLIIDAQDYLTIDEVKSDFKYIETKIEEFLK